LVAPDLVLTAGHCARNLPCDDLNIVFDFYYDERGHPARGLDDEPYRCVEVLSLAVPSELGSLDFAWLRLDRKSLRQPLQVDTNAVPAARFGEVWAMGFGDGGPMKAHTRGTVLDGGEPDLDSFTTDLDLFNGNSGSPVLDDEGRIIGVASAGLDDYGSATGDTCRSVVVSGAGNGGERITYAFQAADALCDVSDYPELCGHPNAGCTAAREAQSPLASCITVAVALSCALRRIRRRGASIESGAVPQTVSMTRDSSCARSSKGCELIVSPGRQEARSDVATT
jgi:hypothetical protein